MIVDDFETEAWLLVPGNLVHTAFRSKLDGLFLKKPVYSYGPRGGTFSSHYSFVTGGFWFLHATSAHTGIINTLNFGSTMAVHPCANRDRIS
ncbi:hypothetical protein QJQ59_05930 (plasmid) [Klebsiella michiganensis]|nr:hypothetical protein QJQ59_01195 [Klebsiella michiganensis]WGZ97658.1 hypothetical protein QJQ59_05930 [Klebsiella michiganensis]